MPLLLLLLLFGLGVGCATLEEERDRDFDQPSATDSTAAAAEAWLEVAEPLDAAVVGAYLHGWTADCLVEDWGSHYGLQASDLVDYFPTALGRLLSPEEESE